VRAAAFFLVALAAVSARAERPLHGSLGAGSTLIATGAEGDRFRFDLALDVKPWSRYGFVLGWRAFDVDRRGLVTAGLVYEGAAARPRLVLDLRAELGVDLDRPAPAAGGGLRTTLTLIGPLALALDTAAYLVIDGIDGTRLQLQGSTAVVVRW
jgi:hypothetical protein